MLWAVYSLSRRWRLVLRRKEIRRRVYEAAADAAAAEEDKAAISACVSALEAAQTLEVRTLSSCQVLSRQNEQMLITGRTSSGRNCTGRAPCGACFDSRLVLRC